MAEEERRKAKMQETKKLERFEDYWPLELVEKGLQDGTLIEGTIRINMKNYKEAYINAPDGSEDILLEGLKHRNRALQGDIVVCQLLLGTDEVDESIRHIDKCEKMREGMRLQDKDDATNKNAKKQLEQMKMKPAAGLQNETGKLGDIQHNVSEKITMGEKKDTHSAAANCNPMKSNRRGNHRRKKEIPMPSNLQQKELSGAASENKCCSVDDKVSESLKQEKQEFSVACSLEQTSEVVSKSDCNNGKAKEKVIKRKSNRHPFKETTENIKMSKEKCVNLNKQTETGAKRESVQTEANRTETIQDGISLVNSSKKIKRKKRIKVPERETIQSTKSTKVEYTSLTVKTEEKMESDVISSSLAVDFTVMINSDVQSKKGKTECHKQKKSQLKMTTETKPSSLTSSEQCTREEKVNTLIAKDECTAEVEDVAVITKKSRRRHRKSKKPKHNNLEVEQLNNEFTESCTLQDQPQRILEQCSITTQSVITENIDIHGETNRNDKPKRRTAKVVFIKEYKHSRYAIGQLRPWTKGPTDKWLQFVPKDYRIPRMKIPSNPELANCLQLKSMLYLGQISVWEEVNQPIGKLSCIVGNSGDLEAETIALLLEAGVDYSDHPPDVANELPKLPWTIPQSELAKRRDYTDQCIFTIDPADARDLDDAVAGKVLGTAEDGVTKLYQVSVHIADVSYFVEENSLLDKVASERATSTYLVDRVIPMLPGVLCETVCSLNPGENRFAFSIEWTIDDNGNILKEWIGRSVIRSCTKLSYDHAQAFIDGTSDVVFPIIVPPFQLQDIRESVQILHELAVKLREKRYRNGALKIDLPRLSFSMDWQTRTPIGFRIYKMRESNQLIEEFMLLANTRVAEKIFSSFPEIAVLRCHPPPQIRLLKGVADTLETLGIHLDISSSGSIQKSLWRYVQQDDDFDSVGRNLVLCNLLAKPLKCAMYICSGLEKSRDAFRHYALSVPLYTHFTSPIRRYPDILVHRLLNAALGKTNMSHWKPEAIRKILNHCNDRKLAAKSVGELHSELHLSALLKRSGPLEVKSVVMGVLDHAVDVILLHIGITRRVYLDKLPLRELNHEIAGGVGTLILEWNPADTSSSPVRQLITLFTVLDVILVPDPNELRFDVVLPSPLGSK